MRHHPDGIPPPPFEDVSMANLYDMLGKTLIAALKKGTGHVAVAEIQPGVSLMILVGSKPSVNAEYTRLINMSREAQEKG